MQALEFGSLLAWPSRGHVVGALFRPGGLMVVQFRRFRGTGCDCVWVLVHGDSSDSNLLGPASVEAVFFSPLPALRERGWERGSWTRRVSETHTPNPSPEQPEYGLPLILLPMLS